MPYPTTSKPEPTWNYTATAPTTGGPQPAPSGSAAPFAGDAALAPVDVLPLPQGEADHELDMLADEFVEEPSTWYRPWYWFGPAPWNTGIELGLNGSSGTNDSLSFRTGGYIKRKSRFSKLDLSGYYNRTTEGSVATQNNAQFDFRNDWLLDDQLPWTLFGSANLFYDQFQEFDLQLNTNVGVGYRFVDDDDLTLIARFGGGASREFGGADNQWVPESLVGFEYSQRLTDVQRFAGKIDYYPEWNQFGEYRLVADAGWEIELVQPSNLSLKISASDRFDSTPNGAEAHLVNYSVLLLWKL